MNTLVIAQNKVINFLLSKREEWDIDDNELKNTLSAVISHHREEKIEEMFCKKDNFDILRTHGVVELAKIVYVNDPLLSKRLAKAVNRTTLDCDELDNYLDNQDGPHFKNNVEMIIKMYETGKLPKCDFIRHLICMNVEIKEADFEKVCLAIKKHTDDKFKDAKYSFNGDGWINYWAGRDVGRHVKAIVSAINFGHGEFVGEFLLGQTVKFEDAVNKLRRHKRLKSMKTKITLEVLGT